ncbi:glycosyltransferase [Ramlibacter sp. USB13]|uniref:Glycosyltransferase n=1 Tax=Ramlibacter cellulosilyticus TaxID=2764187 RepID=A0A923SCE0_9BURK|nr:glycosyltransferase [Ramlibacter cellulosilyticus]MBC5784871.1 glycosyltransferase [Ramlibacter cellulosilyticus]
MPRPVPIAVFAYNRPEHLRRVLTTLASARLANESEVVVFSDGPRTDTVRPSVHAVRGMLRERSWQQAFARFTVEESSANQGLASAIRAGVSKMLERHGTVIVLEDDLLVSNDFLVFMNAALDYYRDDERVASVTGFCPLTRIPQGYGHDVLAVPRASTCGWGIWSDRWSQVDWRPQCGLDVWNNPALKARLNSVGSDQLYRLRRQLQGKINSWGILFCLWQTMTNRLTIYPVHNRIHNIGYDGSGVHTRAGEAKNQTLVESTEPFSLTWPGVDPAVITEFRRTYSGGRLGRIKRWAVNLSAPRLP